MFRRTGAVALLAFIFLVAASTAVAAALHGHAPSGRPWRVTVAHSGGSLCAELKLRVAGQYTRYARDCFPGGGTQVSMATDCDAGETYFFGPGGTRAASIRVALDRQRAVTARVVAIGRNVRFWAAVARNVESVGPIEVRDSRGRSIGQLHAGFEQPCGASG